MANDEKAGQRRDADTSRLERKTISNVGAAIHVEEIKIPRPVREAIERKFDRDQSKPAAATWPKKK